MSLRRPLSLLLFLSLACGDADVVPEPDAGLPADMAVAPDMPAESPDLGGSDMGRADGCTEMTVGEFTLDVITDTGVRILAPLSPELGEEEWGLNVWFQRFGGAASEGTITLGEAPNDDFPDCPHCVIALFGNDLTRGYFATEGTMELREDPFGVRMSFELRDVILTEVTIGEGEMPGTITATPVEDGGCLALPTIDVDGVFPPEEWRCGVERWADGEACDCGCGTWDPDCFPCDEFPPDPTCDPTPLPLVGCGDGQVCSREAECYNDCSESGTCSFGTCVYDLDGQQICETDTDFFDNAAIGEACDMPMGLTYCAEEVGVANGVCAQWIGGDSSEEIPWECRPLCNSDADCDESSFERCELIFGQAAGYCIPDYPRDWTCNPALYDDGTTCHCGCGRWDPDCGDTFGPPPEAVGCADGDVCVLLDEIETTGGTECVTPPTNDTCATAEALTLPYDQVVQTRGAAPDYTAEGCFPFGKTGFDTVYSVTLEAGQTLSVTATPTNDDDNPSLYLVGPGEPTVCDGELTCLAAEEAGAYGEPESFTYTAAEAGTYYLVLDFFAARWLEVRLEVALVGG